ncbi:unnamed protein product [Cuscuta campestris]|uniref:Secreted protein n=1 Tax=Cuscuta campestris TaxID=132261 RepID=A0A484LQQ9_9ASTE|nr:unnamed protein product [Cuscuta campestris]
MFLGVLSATLHSWAPMWWFTTQESNQWVGSCGSLEAFPVLPQRPCLQLFKADVCAWGCLGSLWKIHHPFRCRVHNPS